VSASVHVIRWGQERVRAGPWRGDERVAYLSPAPGAPLPSVAFVRRCLEQLAGQGYRRVVTAALMPHEQGGFVEAGFVVEEQLVLLGHDLRQLPPAPPHQLRRAGPEDQAGVLALDHQAFPPFWQLDADGLEEAVAATPRARFRVAVGGPDVQPPAGLGSPPAPSSEPLGERDHVIGYVVTGRAGRRGYIQRLAVHPDARRGGLGRALVVDGLRWLRRWRADKALVNTQEDNEAAAALYQALGFRREPTGLSVLSARLSE
jgi:ribosomal protein S18 acetylase RimI-like enzyme